MAPSLQKCPGLTTLKHARGAHDHHRVTFLLQNPLIGFEIMNVPVLEWIVYFLVESLLDFFAEHIDVGFINIFAFLYQRNCVVNVDVSKLCFLFFPVLIQYEE